MRENRTVTNHVTLHSSDPKVSEEYSLLHYHTFGLYLGHSVRVDFSTKNRSIIDGWIDLGNMVSFQNH